MTIESDADVVSGSVATILSPECQEQYHHHQHHCTLHAHNYMTWTVTECHKLSQGPYLYCTLPQTALNKGTSLLATNLFHIFASNLMS